MIKTTVTIMIGRTLFGVCAGFFSLLCPLYSNHIKNKNSIVSEIAPTEISGALGSLHQMMICLGVLAATLFGLAVPQVTDHNAPQEEYDKINNNWTWRLILAFPLLISLLQLLLIFIIYKFDSPRYYAENGKLELVSS